MMRLPSEVRTNLEGLRNALEDGLIPLTDRLDSKPIADAHREWIALLSNVIDAETIDEKAIASLENASTEMTAQQAKWAHEPSIAKRLQSGAKYLAESADKLRARVPMRMVAATSQEISVPPQFMASVGVPRAHVVDIPAPRVLLKDDPERTRIQNVAGWSGNTTGDLAQLWALARECFEDIGSLGNLRRLYDHEPWGDATRFEQRLLDSYDAAVSLELPLDPAGSRLGLAEALFAYATEWTIPDYGRTFALAFTLSCLDSEVAMRWVTLALRRSNPKTFPAFVDAFVLGSNPAIDRALAELCRSDDPAFVDVALDAMLRRGKPDMASVVLVLMRPSPSLVSKAIALATRLPSASALPLLNRLLEHADPVLAAHAGAALTTLGDARGPKRLRALLQQKRSDDAQNRLARQIAFETLCLLGSPLDRSLLSVETNAISDGIPWLGWHGHPDHLPTLIEAARRAAQAGTFPECDRIVAGLERMCGLGAPRPGGFGAVEFDSRLSAYIAAFEQRRPLQAERLRLGAAWSATAIVAELSARDSLQGVRPTLARELAIATRGSVHIDVAGWTVQQERILAAARDTVFRQA